MRRRTYLGALSTAFAAAFGGCLTSLSLTQNNMDTKFTVCGHAASQKCADTDVNTNLTELEGVHKENSDGSEAVSVSRSGKESISVTGRTSGIGDPSCRATKLQNVDLEGSTLTVVVRNKNNPPLMGSCYETIEPNYYQLDIKNFKSTVSKVYIRHYNEQDLQFDVSAAIN